MSTTATYGTLSASEHSTQLRKAVIASLRRVLLGCLPRQKYNCELLCH
jgi:hypothetical protein